MTTIAIAPLEPSNAGVTGSRALESISPGLAAPLLPDCDPNLGEPLPPLIFPPFLHLWKLSEL